MIKNGIIGWVTPRMHHSGVCMEATPTVYTYVRPAVLYYVRKSEPPARVRCRWSSAACRIKTSKQSRRSITVERVYQQSSLISLALSYHQLERTRILYSNYWRNSLLPLGYGKERLAYYCSYSTVGGTLGIQRNGEDLPSPDIAGGAKKQQHSPSRI
jgi:hypothetical protein